MPLSIGVLINRSLAFAPSTAAEVGPERVTEISAIAASRGITAHPMINVPPWNDVLVKVETDEAIVGRPSAL